jgi:NDP-sugar pyrophosphorylase family protein
MDSFMVDFGDELGEVSAHYHANGGGLVADTATVEPSAYVESTAKVYGNAYIDGTCEILGNSIVRENTVLKRYTKIYDEVEVFGTAMLENVSIHGKSKVSITPKSVLGFDHPIVITDTHVIIGCQEMDFDYWKEHGTAIIKVNGYPTRTAIRIHRLIDEVKDLRFSFYDTDDIQEVVHEAENRL